MAHGADLQHHHAHGVGDHVVQLTRDPDALLGDGDPRGGLALALGVACALLRDLGPHAALTQPEAGEPGRREQARHQERLGRGMARIVDDHDHPAPDHDRQPDAAALALVAEVAQQKRGRQTGELTAERERHQAPVDERQRGGEQPQRRRRTERPAMAPEQRQDERRRGRNREPQRGRRCLVAASQRDLEAGLGRRQDDQQIEPVAADEGLQAGHPATVLHARGARLLL